MVFTVGPENTSVTRLGEESNPVELSKEGKMTLKISDNNLSNRRLNLKALEALVKIPGMLSKVKHLLVEIKFSRVSFDFCLCWDLPQIKEISFVAPGSNESYIGAPTPRLLEHESSLQTLFFQLVNNLTSDNLNELLRTIGSNLQSLSFESCRISDAELAVIGQFCPHLESFSVTDSIATTNGISSVLQNNPGVKTLHVSGSTFCNHIDGEEFVSVLARDCLHLQTLNLCWSMWCNDDIFKRIIEALPDLHSVILFFNNMNTEIVTATGVRRALEQSSKLGRGQGKVSVTTFQPLDGQKATWEKLKEDFPDVNFSFDWL